MATKIKQWTDGSSATIQYDGHGDGQIIITSDPNNHYEARSMQITVGTTDGSGISRTVTIQQAAGVEFVPVEYLESARDVNMNTGIIPSIDMSFCVDFAVVNSENKTNVVFESAYSWATGECVYLQVHGIWKWARVQFSDATNGTGNNAITNAKTNAVVNANGMFLNGKRILGLSPSETFSGYSSSIKLFSTSGMRLYGFKCENDGGVVMDLVPGRIGQVGYMYDRVSGQMFGGNSGDFILGNDV